MVSWPMTRENNQANSQNGSLRKSMSYWYALAFTPNDEFVKYVRHLFGPPLWEMKASASTIFNSLFNFGYLNIF